MHICIAGPIASAELAHRLHPGGPALPAGYPGAPLVAVLIDELLARGHRVHALTVDYTLPPASPEHRAAGERLTLQILPGRRRAWRFEGGRPGRAIDLFRHERAALAAAMRAAAPDLVHAHWTYEFAHAALDSGLPHLITAHDAAGEVLRHSRGPYRAARWLMARSALARARHVSAVSDCVAARLQKLVSAAIHVVPNPVAPLALALGRERDRARALRIVLASNGWRGHKNARAALRAFALLCEKQPAAELHAYGRDFEPDGPARAWAHDQGLAAKVRCHGPLPHRELLEAMNGADLLLHPSLDESFGVVIAEAMALGLPVVAGAASGAVPWVAGAAQWLVDVRSPRAIAAALEQALTDPARYAAASRAARERSASRFAPGPVAEAYLALYRQVLEELRCAA